GPRRRRRLLDLLQALLEDVGPRRVHLAHVLDHLREGGYLAAERLALGVALQDRARLEQRVVRRLDLDIFLLRRAGAAGRDAGGPPRGGEEVAPLELLRPPFRSRPPPGRPGRCPGAGR